ncbi:MAG TPA: hypothetical protein VFE24_16530 [Pirellulales bacterium]|jgi:hypothetical protein|nr:hypothetical protein [Pirellulales bacterium]
MGRKFGILFALFCVGTVLSLMLGIGYLSMTGKLNKEKIGRIIAVAQGLEIAAPPAAAPASSANKPAPEAHSLDELDQMRSLKIRQMDLRELNLTNGMEMISSIKQYIDKEKQLHSEVHDAFKNELEERNRAVNKQSRDSLRELWEALKPKLAKEEILRMMETGAKEDIVAILSAMPISKRAKIVSEFKTEEDTAKLDELLQMIRQGQPETTIIDKTRQRLDQFKTDEK